RGLIVKSIRSFQLQVFLLENLPLPMMQETRNLKFTLPGDKRFKIYPPPNKVVEKEENNFISKISNIEFEDSSQISIDD
ncbi:26873_t:CDS:2, partial [Dentiscutata erythropus]